MTDIFFQLSAILGIALVLSLAMKLLRQPLIIGYIITGILVGPGVFGLIQSGESLTAFAHLGVALLLFIVGLGLRPQIIHEVGKTALFTGVGQILFTTAGGFILAKLMGYPDIVAMYLAFAFALGSTIIILKLLYNKEEQDTLYGRITIGFMLVQDIVVMLMFLVVSTAATVGSGNFLPSALVLIGKLALVFVCLFLLMRFITPRIDKLFAGNRELLFVFSLGVCFVVASVFYKLNFSYEFGALVAGVMLSISPYQREISMRLLSLRDFFLIIFFIALGTNINFSDLNGQWGMVIAFSLFIILGNPLILMLVLRFLRYTVKTSFLVGLTVTQISEFSLVLIGMGIAYGHMPKEILGAATMVGLITIAVSSYFITYNHQIYNFLKSPLSRIFRDRVSLRETAPIVERYEVILFGCHRLGGGLIKALQKMRVKFLVVDHDPDVISVLTEKKIPALFGSADDSNLLDSLPLNKAELVISTIPDSDLNLYLVAHAKKRNRRINFICISNHTADTEKLYKAGASYVIMPPYLGRRFMADLFMKNQLDYKKYAKERKKHIADLEFLAG